MTPSRDEAVGSAGTRATAHVVPGVEKRVLVPSGDRMRGVHAGFVVFAGVALANIGNAVFHLVAGRALGPSAYADLATLLAVLGLVAFPLGAAQLALAQSVAQLAAHRQSGAVSAVYGQSMAVALVGGAALTVLFAVATPLIQLVLDVDSTAAIVLTAACTLPAAVAPVVTGLAQGLERFVLFAATQAAGPLMRIGWLLVALAAGAGVAGAVSATLAASALAVLIPAWALRVWLTTHFALPSPAAMRTVARRLLPIVLGILAFTSLTTIDVVVAKIAFSDHDAGIYGGASLVGRLTLYVPTAIVSVLLPKVSSRAALGRRTTDILFGSLAVTAVVCLTATAVFAAAPGTILSLSFGAEYADARDFLWLFGIAMTGFALVNVFFVYDLGMRSSAVSWLLAGGAVVQALLFAFVHDSPEHLLMVDIVVAIGLLVCALAVTRGRHRSGHARRR